MRQPVNQVQIGKEYLFLVFRQFKERFLPDGGAKRVSRDNRQLLDKILRHDNQTAFHGRVVGTLTILPYGMRGGNPQHRSPQNRSLQIDGVFRFPFRQHNQSVLLAIHEFRQFGVVLHIPTHQLVLPIPHLVVTILMVIQLDGNLFHNPQNIGKCT